MCKNIPHEEDLPLRQAWPLGEARKEETSRTMDGWMDVCMNFNDDFATEKLESRRREWVAKISSHHEIKDFPIKKT